MGALFLLTNKVLVWHPEYRHYSPPTSGIGAAGFTEKGAGRHKNHEAQMAQHNEEDVVVVQAHIFFQVIIIGEVHYKETLKVLKPQI